ncbi:substrate-binding domain-containing protein [Nocardia salmonicida]|uniref:substrate-binding domain-containing protein n=1 Tax=Nocardia salmonicida TaxID=53431 RepID=UPI0037885E68
MILDRRRRNPAGPATDLAAYSATWRTPSSTCGPTRSSVSRRSPPPTARGSNGTAPTWSNNPARSRSIFDIAIGQRQAAHLISHGYQALATAVPVDQRERPFAHARAARANERARRNGNTVLPTLHIELGRERPLLMVENLPDLHVGIAAYHDNVALAVLGAAHQVGRRIPEDLGIIGIDNCLIAQIAVPSLTTLDFDLEYGARQLLRLVGTHEYEPFASREAESRLRIVDRESTARARADLSVRPDASPDKS